MADGVFLYAAGVKSSVLCIWAVTTGRKSRQRENGKSCQESGLGLVSATQPLATPSRRRHYADTTLRSSLQRLHGVRYPILVTALDETPTFSSGTFPGRLALEYATLDIPPSAIAADSNGNARRPARPT